MYTLSDNLWWSRQLLVSSSCFCRDHHINVMSDPPKNVVSNTKPLHCIAFLSLLWSFLDAHAQALPIICARVLGFVERSSNRRLCFANSLDRFSALGSAGTCAPQGRRNSKGSHLEVCGSHQGVVRMGGDIARGNPYSQCQRAIVSCGPLIICTYG